MVARLKGSSHAIENRGTALGDGESGVDHAA
jgi:hypothetical protein